MTNDELRDIYNVLHAISQSLERIARQLERRDVAEVVYSDDAAEIDQFLSDGWAIIGGPNDSGAVLMGRPRAVEGGGEGG